jgi:PAS domain S-box-containing protein
MAVSNPKTIEQLFPVPENFSEIFDFIPDVNFYVKDRESRWRKCNSAALASFNARTTEDILGRSELELFPLHIAEPILKDDRHVMDTGQPLVNKMEVVVDEHGHLIWVTTTKLPTRAPDGSITGIMGVTRILRRTEMLPEGYRQFSKAVCFIRRTTAV